MPLTHFPYGVSSFGCPVMPSFPFSGDSRYYYVDNVYGNDGNSGTDPSQAFKTIAKANTVMRSGYYDTCFIIGLGTAYVLAAPLLITNSYVNFVGLCSNVQLSQRARITNGTTLMSPMVTNSGTGNTFINLQFANFGNDTTAAAICFEDTGQRNYYQACQFAGGGSSAARGNAAMRSLVISGSGGENLFRNCTIGLDTILGTGANYELEINGGSPRNMFDHCDIIKNSGAAGFFFLIGASGIDRFVEFRECTFYNFTGGGGASLTDAYTINAAAGGNVIMRLCLFIGMTALPASSLVFGDPTAASTAILKGLSPT